MTTRWCALFTVWEVETDTPVALHTNLDSAFRQDSPLLVLVIEIVVNIDLEAREF